MTTEPSEVESLALQLFSDNDDEEDLMYKPIFQTLVDGTVTPSEAAVHFDAWVVNESNRRLAALMKRPEPTLSHEEEEKGMHLRAILPNASGNIELAFSTIAKLFSSFPPYHAGQDRIIQFLEALRAMPEHQAPDGLPSGDSSGSDHLITLWPFGDDWMALDEIFYQEANEYFHEYSDVETLGSETRVRWRNFQSAIARITVLGLIDCGFFCALGSILPSSQFYPDLDQRKIGGPNRVGGDAIAGAQWILQPNEGAYVYQQCKKVQKADGVRDMWSMERWDTWKEQFAFISGDERFDSKARDVARLAHQHMLRLEDDTAGN